MALPASRSRFLKFREVSEGRPRADIKPEYCEWPIPVCKAPRPALEFMSRVADPRLPVRWLSAGRILLMEQQLLHFTFKIGIGPSGHTSWQLLASPNGPLSQY